MAVYNCILADPPWTYGDSLQMSDVKRSAQDQYDVMTVEDICGMSVRKDGQRVLRMMGWDYVVADTALLWLWVTNTFLINGAGARVCQAWGFEPKQLITWVKGELDEQGNIPRDCRGPLLKLAFGMGRYTRGCTEHLILATRGEATDLVTNRSQRNLLLAPARDHSQKPDEAYELIEQVQGYKSARNLTLYGDDSTRRLELFARQRRAGWTQAGNELGG